MTTDERLERLERELARTKRQNRLLLLAGVTLAASLSLIPPLTGQATKAPTTLRAERFELVDEKGKPRATLALFGDGAQLYLSDANEKHHAGLRVVGGDGGGPSLFMTDEKHNPRAMLHVTYGMPSLSLNDKNNKVRAALFLTEDQPTLSLYDESGKPRAKLAMAKDIPRLSLYDKEGRHSAGLAATRQGSMMYLHDANGKPRAAMAVTKDGTTLGPNDENGEPRAGPITIKDGTILYLYDESGKEVWSAPR